jgi:hypothetical protein
MLKNGVFGFAIIALIMMSATISIAQETAGDSRACSNFVQKFYDWYLAKCNQKNLKVSPDELAIQQKSQWFSPELIRDLKVDLDAASKSKDGIVGLDFDPFLNAQDVATRYAVGKASWKNGKWYVDVYGTWNGKKNAKPDVVPELTYSKGTWVFTNFDYEETPKSNLLAVLKQLREERKQTK